MQHLLVVLAAVLPALVAIYVAMRVALRRRSGGAAGESHVLPPRSLVRLLGNEEELVEAARRAARYEQRAAEHSATRAAQYEAMARARVSPPSEATVHDLGERSAL